MGSACRRSSLETELCNSMLTAQTLLSRFPLSDSVRLVRPRGRKAARRSRFDGGGAVGDVFKTVFACKTRSERFCMNAESHVVIAEHSGRRHKLRPDGFRSAEEATDVLSCVPRLQVSEDTLPVRPAEISLPFQRLNQSRVADFRILAFTRGE